LEYYDAVLNSQVLCCRVCDSRGGEEEGFK
jgi:hypothetical protein